MLCKTVFIIFEVISQREEHNTKLYQLIFTITFREVSQREEENASLLYLCKSDLSIGKGSQWEGYVAC